MSNKKKRKKPGTPPSVRRGETVRGRTGPGRDSVPAPDRLVSSSDPNGPIFNAIHEASHAVSAIVLGIRLRHVHINRRRLPDGRISWGWTATGPLSLGEIEGKGEEALRHVVQCFTGPAGERMVNPDAASGMLTDQEDAHTIAVAAFCTPVESVGQVIYSPEEMLRHKDQMDTLICSAVADAFDLVQKYWPAIQRVAALLIERKYLTGEEVAEIVRNTPTAT